MKAAAKAGTETAGAMFDASVAAALDVPVVVTDARGNVTFWSKALEEMSGRAADGMMGQKAWRGFFDKKKKTPLEAALRFGEEQEEEFSFSSKDGEEHVVNFEVTPLLDGDDEAVGAVGILRAEANGKSGSDLTEAIPTPVISIDRDYNLLSVNGAAAAALGRTPDELLGKKCYDFFQTAHCRTEECRCARAMRDEGTHTGETEANLPSGKLPIRYTGAPLRDAQGQIVGAVEYVVDITEEKASRDEANLKVDYLEAIPTPVMAIDKEFTVQYVNPAAIGALGSRKEDCEGRKCFDLFKTAHCNTGDCRCGQAMRDGGTHTGETVANLPTGELPIRYTGAPLYDANGHIMGALEYVLDVSVEKDVQAGVQDCADELQTVVADQVRPIATEVKGKSAAIAERSRSVAVAAEQLAANMAVVAENGQQAQSRIASVAAATEEMSATVADVAGSAEKARSVADNAVKSVASASNRVDELGKAAKEISLVTETIMEIAEQTKLLALNATIEAARAGEAGKGFAVVASEVKDLAKQTNSATADIRAKIEAIQNSSESTISEIGAITDVIAEVNDFVAAIATATEEQTATTKDIAINISNVSDGIREMAKNVDEAATVTKEVTGNIAEVSDAAAEVDTTSDRLNSTVLTLGENGDRLVDVVGRFDRS